MASPARKNTNFTQITAAASPWTVNLPPSILAGELLVLYTRAASTQTIASITGWTFLVDDDTSDASDDNTCVFYRWADGTEGATVSVTLSASAKGAAFAYSITGAIDPATQPPEITTAVTSAAANVDPPIITPTGGSKDYLFIVLGGCDGETQTWTPPAGYTDDSAGGISSGTGGAVATNCRICMAHKQATASSENPAAWAVAAPATGASAWTIAVHPPAAAGAVSDPTTWINDRRTPRRRSMQRW